jgi:hypothetical protein
MKILVMLIFFGLCSCVTVDNTTGRGTSTQNVGTVSSNDADVEIPIFTPR